MTWMPTRDGAVIELVEPDPAQVDFADIAWSLAHLNRYSGHGARQVSVAQHTLIGLKMCPEALRPWWLLHDAEESRTGDLTRPAYEALLAIARESGGERQAKGFVATWEAFRARHTLAIHKAAGLAPPSFLQSEAIKAIDLRALATEHRDFHAPSARAWVHEEAGILPDRTPARAIAADKAADALMEAFRTYLPALQPATRAASISAARPARRRA